VDVELDAAAAVIEVVVAVDFEALLFCLAGALTGLLGVAVSIPLSILELESRLVETEVIGRLRLLGWMTILKC